MAKLNARKVNENSMKIANQANPQTGKIRVWDKATGKPMDVWPVDGAEAVAMGTATFEKLDGPVAVEPEVEVPPEKIKKKPVVKKNPPKAKAKAKAKPKAKAKAKSTAKAPAKTPAKDTEEAAPEIVPGTESSPINEDKE